MAQRRPPTEEPRQRTLARESELTDFPRRWKVLMHDDEHTPLDFVLKVLVRCFGMSIEQAQGLAIEIGRDGVGVCGVYTREIAEAKTAVALELARQHNHPLSCTMEQE